LSEPESVVQIIDDDDTLRDFLGLLLERAGFRVRSHKSAVAFLAVADGLPPGCVITDVRMPGIGGLELIKRLKAMGVGHPVIVLSGHGEIPLVVEAMRVGAVDFLEKPIDGVMLLDRVRAAMDASPEAIQRALRAREARRTLATLSGREREVLEGLVSGKSTKVIAAELGIGSRTVEEYRANVNTKMGVSSFSELVQLAVLAGGNLGD
jgi:two-component system, LuxR family, response regulator FixJ